jgi:hypothetical protein
VTMQIPNGFWFVTIQPIPRNNERIALNDLVLRISHSRVFLRGWDYPHIDDQTRYLDGAVENSTDWREYHERWRFTTSGLFVHRWKMREDGIPERIGTLDFINAIWSMTEVLVFASRLYAEDETVDQVTVSLELSGLRNRQLTSRPDYWINVRHLPTEDIFRRETTLSRVALVAHHLGIAARWAQALFHVMGAPGFTEDVIKSHQQRLLERRLA